MCVSVCSGGGENECVFLCMSVWTLCWGGGGCVGVFRNKLGVRGRRVDARMGELRGRSVRVTREEEGVWG